MIVTNRNRYQRKQSGVNMGIKMKPCLAVQRASLLSVKEIKLTSS